MFARQFTTSMYAREALSGSIFFPANVFPSVTPYGGTLSQSPPHNCQTIKISQTIIICNPISIELSALNPWKLSVLHSVDSQFVKQRNSLRINKMKGSWAPSPFMVVTAHAAKNTFFLIVTWIKKWIYNHEVPILKVYMAGSWKYLPLQCHAWTCNSHFSPH